MTTPQTHINLPPKPFTLQLLVALATGEAHVYLIERRMIEDVQGAITISSRAVYREIPRLVRAKLIRPIEATHPQRYQLTPFGRRILNSERERASRIFRLLQKRL